MSFFSLCLQFTLGQAHVDLEQYNSEHKMKIDLSSIFHFVFTLGQAHVNLVKKISMTHRCWAKLSQLMLKFEKITKWHICRATLGQLSQLGLNTNPPWQRHGSLPRLKGNGRRVSWRSREFSHVSREKGTTVSRGARMEAMWLPMWDPFSSHTFYLLATGPWFALWRGVTQLHWHLFQPELGSFG